MGQAIMVGMAEVKVARGPGEVLVALGLGSCIGICAFDKVAGVVGMVHVVLPECIGDDAAPGKFANTAVPVLLDEMRKMGAVRDRIRVAIAGGAQLFSFGGNGTRLDVGVRNAAAVKQALEEHRLPMLACDVGGNAGRTVHLFGENGRVRVKTIGQGERDLITLGDADHAPLRRAA